MAETFPLAAQKRTISRRSARETRNESRVPGIVYGHGVENVSISVDNSDILKTYRKAGTATLIDLDIEGKSVQVLIHQLEIHPVRDEITHVDFYAVNLKEATTVSVPLVFVGEPGAVKNFGGTLVKDLDSLSIRCLPTEIPHDIEVDVSGLENLHDHVIVKDLGLDLSKYELMGGLTEETTICSIIGRGASESEEELGMTAEELEAAEASESGEGEGGDAPAEEKAAGGE